MKVIDSPNRIEKQDLARGTVVAIGCFDGMHRGHMALVSRLEQLSARRGLTSVILTFPLVGKSLLTGRERKHFLEQRSKISYMLEQEFDDAFANLSPEEFVKDYLVSRLNCKVVVIGFNNRFGSDARGTPEDMVRFGEKYGFDVIVEPKVRVTARFLPAESGDFICDEDTVSSTSIKHCMDNAEIEIANDMLGYTFFISGMVCRGKQLGRRMGFPTANIHPEEAQYLPPNGVYAVKVQLEGREYVGMANLGVNPTVDDLNASVLEVNIFDFDEDIYDSIITVEFMKFVRPEKKFESVDELFEEIRKNKEQILKYYRENRTE